MLEGKDRPNTIWKEIVSKDLQILGINANLAKDRTQIQCKREIHIGDIY